MVFVPERQRTFRVSTALEKWKAPTCCPRSDPRERRDCQSHSERGGTGRQGLVSVIALDLPMASHHEQMFFPMKLVVVGDGAVGKTSMLLCYTTNTFPTDYMATVFDNYAVNVPYGERTVNLSLWDTAGQDEYKQFRPLSYDKADGFIVAFSLVDRVSFENVASRWIKELRADEKTKRAPVILVGTKLDLRSRGGRAGDDARNVVTTEQGERMAQKIGAKAYVECSALTQDNLKKVFDVSVDVSAKTMFEAREGGKTADAGKSGCCVVS